MKKIIILLFVTVFMQVIAYAQQDTVFVYGPGGPYPAIKEAALVFSKKIK